MDALDALAAEGRQAGKLGRPISDCPAKLDDEERRALARRLARRPRLAGREPQGV